MVFCLVERGSDWWVVVRIFWFLCIFGGRFFVCVLEE